MRSTWNYSPYSRPDQTSREGGDRFICLFHFTAGTISTVPFGAIGRRGEKTGRRSTSRRPKSGVSRGAPIRFGRNWDEFHHLRLEPFPAGARLMVKWRVGRPPIPPDHPLPSEKSRKRSTKPRFERGFAFWRNLTIRNAVTFSCRGTRRGARMRHQRRPPRSPAKGELQRLGGEGELAAQSEIYRRAWVCTLSVTGVPARTASSERSSAGMSCFGPSTFSPRPPQVSTTFS